MTTTQSRTLARIDHERRAAASAIRGRLMRADKRGDDLAESIRRLAFIAYLKGMKRTLLDASAAIGKDARSAHYELSRREDDEERENDQTLWLLAFLGLAWTTVEFQRYRAGQVVENAGGELRTVARTAAEKRLAVAEREAVRTGGQARATQQGATSRLYEPAGMGSKSTNFVDLKTANPRRGAKTETVSEMRTADPSVFGRFGVADVQLKVPQTAIDTWAETVAYTQYERGRYEARNEFPAVSDALWGYRWSSILDTRTTSGCRGLDGYVGPVDDPWLKALAPPRHWNCRSVLIPVYESTGLKKPPTPFRPPSLTDATLQRYLAQKEEFTRRLA